ncbi:hypothetical protein RSOL_352310 [Rhizoctonia solani AG-3 Rhs1AP]|uniref:Thuringiensis toxin domain protein n=3 Tax=Rhizoctonia solani AG-3 TaxID=1086053 RepID=A0A074S113_9AGAM|nr:hypothetical protein [Rhizoctonia solani AG-3]AJA33391.1 delta endotoxin CytB-like protein [Rhizoctonia solani AG-3]EUC60562.1 hypothetical protein RSOL_352310 [Rhizoctonia solani AG-3 Rhs1AP]KEP50598.1 thuringiensis toxin domain protein [Rhizoctonia solani 123E]
MSDAPVFDQYGTLPGHLQNPAKQVMKYCGYFLNVETQSFNWQAFKDAIDMRPDVDMVIEQYDYNKIIQQENTVDVMVDKIADLLMKVASVIIDKVALAEIILNAFTSLEQKEDSGFAWYEKEGNNTAFTYRLLFAVVNEHVPDDFYTLVTTIKLVADIKDKQSWFGLVKTTRKNFSAECTTMRLACSKNFIAGPRPPM